MDFSFIHHRHLRAEGDVRKAECESLGLGPFPPAIILPVELEEHATCLSCLDVRKKRLEKQGVEGK